MADIFFSTGNIISKVGNFITGLYDTKNDPVDKWMISRVKTSGGTKKEDSVYKYRGYYYSLLEVAEREYQL